MDIDTDLDASLLQQFSCLGTTDRDVLISQLQKLLGNQLNAAGCAFFLDMNNWNLQAAVCSYFDFESPRDNLPTMSFVKDVTIGEGEAVPPNTKFLKTWKIQNPGDDTWPIGCCLRFTSGDQLGHTDRVLVEVLKPHEMTDVSVEMVSPQMPGIYQGQWRMSTATGQFFGEVIWVIITVAEGGLLGLTQQMDAFHHLGSPPRTSHMPLNPFASPNCKFGETLIPGKGDPGNNQQDTPATHFDLLREMEGPWWPPQDMLADGFPTRIQLYSAALTPSVHLQNDNGSQYPVMSIDNSCSHSNSLPSSPVRHPHQDCEQHFLFSSDTTQDLHHSEPSTEEMIP